MTCSGCGTTLPPETAHPFRCPRAEVTPGIAHALYPAVGFTPPTDDAPNPFVRFRADLNAYAFARLLGMSDADFVALVEDLDARIAEVDGRGFATTPLVRGDELAADLGLARPRTVWIKDETGNVAGSHKARHLMGIALQLAVARALGADPRPEARLAISSCGNAALAAATLAKALGRPLDVFVPTWADGRVLERLEELDASVHACARTAGDEPGDPCTTAFRAAVAEGALPFTVQGTENGLALDGARTIAWELREQRAALDTSAPGLTAVQVGGGALASSLVLGTWRTPARELGDLQALGAFHAVQAAGGHPLHRAWSLIVEEAELTTGLPVDPGERARELVARVMDARGDRARFMWPWETEPRSVATGILDDETYDWYWIAYAMAVSGGGTVVVDDATIERATRRAHELTGICVSPTGAAGLAGLYALAGEGRLPAGGDALVLFTGVR